MCNAWTYENIIIARLSWSSIIIIIIFVIMKWKKNQVQASDGRWMNYATSCCNKMNNDHSNNNDNGKLRNVCDDSIWSCNIDECTTTTAESGESETPIDAHVAEAHTHAQNCVYVHEYMNTRNVCVCVCAIVMWWRRTLPFIIDLSLSLSSVTFFSITRARASR